MRIGTVGATQTVTWNNEDKAQFAVIEPATPITEPKGGTAGARGTATFSLGLTGTQTIGQEAKFNIVVTAPTNAKNADELEADVLQPHGLASDQCGI